MNTANGIDHNPAPLPPPVGIERLRSAAAMLDDALIALTSAYGHPDDLADLRRLQVNAQRRLTDSPVPA